MEVDGGRLGFRLVVWMLTLVTQSQLTSGCPDNNNVTIPCPLNELEGVNCTYVKGLLPETPASPAYAIPGPPKDLNVQPYLRYDSITGNCVWYLNITWRSNPLGCQYLKGFVLTLSFPYLGKQTFINRTYSISVANWENDLLYGTSFRHECVQPFSNMTYEVEVQSLPRSELSQSNPRISYRQMTTSVSYSSQASLSCDHPSDPNRTFDWTATMWVKQNAVDDCGLEVCFLFAPVEFGFEKYRLVLMNITTSVLQETLREATINATGSRQACEKFDNISPGIYQAQVMPLTEPASCVCRAGPGKENCKDYCLPTVLSPIDMTTSVCPSTTMTTSPSLVSKPLETSPTAPPLTTDDRITPSSSPISSSDSQRSKIIGIVVGITAAVVIIVVVIVVVFYNRRCRKYKEMTCKSESPSEELKVSTLPKRLPVLLVYSTDNESHRKVIRSFAAFLHARCGCDVLYDEWSQVEIAQTNPIDWLSKQLYRVKHVIIVNSLGAYEQYRGWAEQRLYVPDSNLLLPDVFIPAIRQIQSKVLLGSSRFQCFHVCFPYTEQKHVLDLSGGKCYKLMDHMEDLFLNVHGLSKFGPKGTTSASQINSTNYLNEREGIALRKAIDEAVDYAREHPDWFEKRYRRDESSTDEVAREEPRNRYFGTESSSGSRNESGTSSIGTASDIEYFPPSPDGSYAVELELPSGSPDAGIGGMNYDAVGEASSPPLFLQFAPLPPDELDDASSIGSRSFAAKINELNEQYDSGFPSSMMDLRGRETDPGDC